LLAGLLLGILPDVLIAAHESARDRRLLAEGRARCGIRAVRGRTLDIGTEWSAGICSISPGHLGFEPTIGIVGDRAIDVVGVSPSDVKPEHAANLGAGQTVTFVLRTDVGDLYWALPVGIAERAIGLLCAGAADVDSAENEGEPGGLARDAL
jgi:hypothetical protein